MTPDLHDCEGLVTAPAGCGKTQLIAQAAADHKGTKPLLVLTHTHAGVAALRARLQRQGTSPKVAKINTIDGWAMNLIGRFPGLSGHSEQTMLKPDYPRIRYHAAAIVKQGYLSDILKANYSRIIVDEYQDCSSNQHQLVSHMANLVPTVVLGDPLQAIFGFDPMDELPEWSQVLKQFPQQHELDVPHRWIKADCKQLGEWTLDVRKRLMAGKPIDLSEAPKEVEWVQLSGGGDDDVKVQAAARPPPIKGGKTLIISTSKPTDHHALASKVPDAIVVEAVDLKGLAAFATQVDPTKPGSHKALVQASEVLATGLNAKKHLTRVEALHAGTADTPTRLEAKSLAFRRKPSYRGAAEFLSAMAHDATLRIHRKTVLDAAYQALLKCTEGKPNELPGAATRVREEYRQRGRELPIRAVGSTLLLKGLEADAAIVLEAETLDTHNLYVALTRGSRAVTICSTSSTLLA